MKNFGQAIKHYWTNYANFKGRTAKSTYWWAVLFVILADTVVRILFPGHQVENIWMDMKFTTTVDSAAYNLWSLATLVPSLSLLVRRLNDVGRSPWAALLLLVPIIGWLILLYFTLQQSKDQIS